jgi:hypothetical protein
VLKADGRQLVIRLDREPTEVQRARGHPSGSDCERSAAGDADTGVCRHNSQDAGKHGVQLLPAAGWHDDKSGAGVRAGHIEPAMKHGCLRIVQRQGTTCPIWQRRCLVPSSQADGSRCQ